MHACNAQKDHKSIDMYLYIYIAQLTCFDQHFTYIGV